MGFTPVLDSREEWYGGDWRDRCQILACGAGAQLYLQITNLAKDIYPSKQTPSGPHQPRFATYDEKETLDGRDDISAVKLLPQTISGRQRIVVGRCNGDLSLLTFEKKKNKFRHPFMLKVGGPPVMSIALNGRGTLAVASSDRTVAFYNMDDELQDHHLIHQSALPQAQQMTKTHTLTWLNDNQLAIGSAFTPYSVEVFDAHGQSLRRFALGPDAKGPSNAVYSLATLNGSSTANEKTGETFLSGSYDGRARRHDMRSPSIAVATFEDNIDYSTIYSLTAYGQERFVAGGAAGLLKVFDLRKNDPKPYRRSSVSRMGSMSLADNHHRAETSGWNVFLSGQRWAVDSPVYALSKPSDNSPTLFAGIEGTVFQMDINSTTDRFPDPVYGEMPDSGHKGHDIRLKWGSKRRILQLSMYEHPKSTTESVKLRKQRPLGSHDLIYWGWDERWK